MFKKLAGLVLGVSLFVASGSAQASVRVQGDQYVKPNLEKIVQILIRYNAIDIKWDDAIDGLMMVSECELYGRYFDDEFKWQQIREAMRTKIRQDVAAFPTGVAYETTLQLDRYDFKEGVYRFKEKYEIRNVNSFQVYNVSNPNCNGKNVIVFPLNYRAVLDKPLRIQGIPLAEADAKALHDRMESSGNVDRMIPARFNLRINYIAPLMREDHNVSYAQRISNSSSRIIRFDVSLGSVDFYEDPAMTRLLYSYHVED